MNPAPAQQQFKSWDPASLSTVHKKKIACLACRTVKVRCDIQAGRSKCQRCIRLKTPCELKARRRPPNAKQQASTSQAPAEAPVPSTSAPPPAETADNANWQMREPDDRPSSPDDSNQSTDEDDWHDYLLPAAAAVGSLNLSEDTGNSQDGDPILMSYVTSSEAENLFRVFYTDVNPMLICAIDPVIYTLEHTRATSIPLFTTILAVAARFELPDVYLRLRQLAENQISRIWTPDTSPTLEHILAYLILAAYRPLEDTAAYRQMGLVVRLAYELGLHRAPKGPEKHSRAQRSRERAWFALTSFDELVRRRRGLPAREASAGRDAYAWWREGRDAGTPEDALVASTAECQGLEPGALADSELPAQKAPRPDVIGRNLEARVAQWAQRWTSEDVLNSVPQGTRLLIEFHRNTQAFHLAEDRFRHARGPAKEILSQKDDMTSGIVTRLRCALFNTAFGCIAQITKFGPWLRYAPEFVPVLSAHYAVWLATHTKGADSSTRDAVRTVIVGCAQVYANAVRGPHDTVCVAQAQFLNEIAASLQHPDPPAPPSTRPAQNKPRASNSASPPPPLSSVPSSSMASAPLGSIVNPISASLASGSSSSSHSSPASFIENSFVAGQQTNWNALLDGDTGWISGGANTPDNFSLHGGSSHSSNTLPSFGSIGGNPSFGADLQGGGYASENPRGTFVEAQLRDAFSSQQKQHHTDHALSQQYWPWYDETPYKSTGYAQMAVGAEQLRAAELQKRQADFAAQAAQTGPSSMLPRPRSSTGSMDPTYDANMAKMVCDNPHWSSLFPGVNTQDMQTMYGYG
ncbi:hypothetical protein EV122DRAFT_262161 [Schizophyllum commune]